MILFCWILSEYSRGRAGKQNKSKMDDLSNRPALLQEFKPVMRVTTSITFSWFNGKYTQLFLLPLKNAFCPYYFPVVDFQMCEELATLIFELRLKPTIDNDFPPRSRISGDFYLWPFYCSCHTIRDALFLFTV